MPASLLRRIGAMIYDTLLLLAVLMLVTGAMLLVTGGEAIRGENHPVLVWVYRLALFLAVVGFFGTFWTRGGQTLGMAAWHLRIEREDGSRLTWRDTVVRVGAALLSWAPAGLGYLWILVDRDRLAWHDRLSHTRVVHVPKK